MQRKDHKKDKPCQLSWSFFSRPILMLSLLFCLLLSPLQKLQAEITYGPVLAGQSLWDIAKETRPDDSVSIEQVVYAIYVANPDAFLSGNMNLLQVRSYLTIPDKAFIEQISPIDAKKEISQHVHALDVLRVDARQLHQAKLKLRKYKKQLRRLQKKLAKYRHRSAAWNKTYRRLVVAKRKLAKMRRKVAKLQTLLVEKTTLKYARPAIKQAVKPIITDVKRRLNSIETNVSRLKESNARLVEKVKELAALNQRVKVLEEELGNNDAVVIQLQKTLQEVQQEVIKQKSQSDAHYQELLELKKQAKAEQATESKAETPILTPDQSALDNRPTAIQASMESFDFKSVTPLNLDSQLVIENKTSINPMTHWAPKLSSDQRITDKMDATISQQRAPGAPNRVYASALKANFTPDELASLFKTGIATEEITHQKLMDSRPASKSHQRKPLSLNIASPVKPASQFTEIKRNIILYGGILNGFILLFVLYRLFASRPSKSNTEDSPVPVYKSWQDREKPRLG